MQRQPGYSVVLYGGMALNATGGYGTEHKRLVEEEDEIKEGQPLATLSGDETQSSIDTGTTLGCTWQPLHSKKSNLAVAKERLGSQRVGS